MLMVNASRSTAQIRATEKIGRQMPTGICREKKPEKCRIDAYNATFPSCFTISQVLTLSPMKEKTIYKQHIDRRALNILFLFFSSFLFFFD